MNWMWSSMIMLVISALIFSKPVQAIEQEAKNCPDILNFTFKRLGQPAKELLCQQYEGKLLLVVNTASKCVFTAQYEGLEKLYRQYKDQGLVILGFPSNDFAGQEPGTEKQILNFCRLTYSIEFPMFEKVHASQPLAGPFYKKMAEMSGKFPSWNFHKYLISPNGNVIGSFKSSIEPSDQRLIEMIKENLPHR